MMYDGDGWMWGHGWGWGGWVLMSAVMVLFLVAFVTAMVLAIRYLTASREASGRPASYGQSRSESLLAERFTLGEVDEDECRRRMTVLREHR
ncbi:hypothetical protein [Mycolicibacterium tusciae]|uniref:hypothetical protein n=1 Tax=Mycolicibacterium tusciae TaxID=75922 RepID=UPI00024A3EE8|nr:hypothetical protein [Mycolicibacterium tusciae]